MDLSNKLKTLEINPDSIIPAKILGTVKNHYSDYKRARVFLVYSLNVFDACRTSILNHPEKDSVKYYESPFKINELINDVNDDLEKLNSRFAYKIQDIFNSEYNARLEYRNLKFKEERPAYSEESHIEYEQKKTAYNTSELSYLDIVKDLLDQCNGSPETFGIDSIINTFHKSVCRHGYPKLTLKNKAVILEDYFYYRNYSWENEYKLEMREDHCHPGYLIRALNYFLYGKPDNTDNYFYFDSYTNVDFTNDYGNDRVRINLYKNGNVKLTFQSSQDAVDFLNKFNISQGQQVA